MRPTDSSNDLNPPFSSNHQQQQQLQDEKQTSIDLLTSLAPLAEQLLTLLYTICQSSDAALSKVTSLATAASVGSSSSSSSANLLTFLLALALQTREATISVAAGYCINVLTEDNKLVAQFLTRPGTPYLDQLFSWLSSVCASGPTLAVSTLTTQTAVLVGHVLYNLRMHIKNDGAADLMHAVFAAISHGIQKSSNCSSDGSGDVFEAVKLAVDAVLVQQSTANSNQVETLKEGVDHELKETAEEVKRKQTKYKRETGLNGYFPLFFLQKKLNRILKQVASLQMALELAANAFSEDLPNEEEEGVDDQDEEMQEDEDENDDDEDFQADAQLGPNNGEDDVVDSSYQTSSESVNSTLLSLLPLITRIAQTATAFSIAASTPASSESSSVIADDATAAVKTVGIRALCALGNLVDRLPAGWVKSHLADVKTLWSWLFDLAMSASPSPSPPTPPAADDSGLPSSSSLVAETIDATVGVMWAVLRRIEECVNLDSIPVRVQS